MKKFFSEYGHLTLAAVIVALLVAMASPVGNLIKASTTELVTTCGESTNNFVNSFEVTDLNGSEESTGSPVINGPTVNLISFTIQGVEYQAIEGMTWEQWVGSDYNTGNFAVINDTIALDNGVYPRVVLNSIAVLSSDEIIANPNYKIKLVQLD